MNIELMKSLTPSPPESVRREEVEANNAEQIRILREYLRKKGRTPDGRDMACATCKQVTGRCRE